MENVVNQEAVVTAPAPKRRGRPPKSAKARPLPKPKPVDEAGNPLSKDVIAILERRLKDPNLYGSGTIDIKDGKGWTLRWVNTGIEGRYSKAIGMQGLTPVRVSELKDARQIPDLFKTPDGMVARGERGREILMKIPTEYFEAIQRRKVEINRAKSSGKALKNMIVQRAEAERGERAAESISRMSGQIVDTVEQIALDPNEGPPSA